MRISDWSSDVCSSDLVQHRAVVRVQQQHVVVPVFLPQVPLVVVLQRERAAHGVGVQERELEHRSEEHTSELQSLMRISYAVFCLKKKNKKTIHHNKTITAHDKDSAIYTEHKQT